MRSYKSKLTERVSQRSALASSTLSMISLCYLASLSPTTAITLSGQTKVFLTLISQPRGENGMHLVPTASSLNSVQRAWRYTFFSAYFRGFSQSLVSHKQTNHHSTFQCWWTRNQQQHVNPNHVIKAEHSQNTCSHFGPGCTHLSASKWSGCEMKSVHLFAVHLRAQYTDVLAIGCGYDFASEGSPQLNFTQS